MSQATAAQSFRKCTLVSADIPSVSVTATYNPNKISIKKSVPWQAHPSAGSSAEALEYTSGKNQTLSVELFFDGVEVPSGNPIDIQKEIDKLLQLTLPEIDDKTQEQLSKGKNTNRPHFVLLVWGDMPSFKGVISSVDVNYTAFLPSGKPYRATCNVSMTELDAAQAKGKVKSA